MQSPPADLAAEIETRARSARLISLFLDFDGTLVPINEDPAAPCLDADSAATLKMLARQTSLVTTIISGRAIEDLYARVRLEGMIYAGNHGLEIFGRQLSFVEPVASRNRDALARLSESLTAELQSISGAFLEYKGLTATVHYRQAAEADWEAVRRIVYTAIARHGDLFRANPGRKIYDIVPRTNWHKGAAVQWINEHLGKKDLLTVYLGDDTSDEDAFSVLPNAVTIKVGAQPVTCARYRLPDPPAVYDFLSWLSHGCPQLTF